MTPRIRGCRAIQRAAFFVYREEGSEAIVNKRLWINPGPAAAKKYYEKGSFFLKFGTAFG
jgi:hypothetical protein